MYSTIVNSLCILDYILILYLFLHEHQEILNRRLIRQHTPGVDQRQKVLNNEPNVN